MPKRSRVVDDFCRFLHERRVFFRREYPLGGSRYKLDVYASKTRRAVEFQSYFHTLPGQYEEDVHKRELARKLGIEVLWAWPTYKIGRNLAGFERVRECLTNAGKPMPATDWF